MYEVTFPYYANVWFYILLSNIPFAILMTFYISINGLSTGGNIVYFITMSLNILCFMGNWYRWKYKRNIQRYSQIL